MKFISYEIRQMCIDPLGADPLPVSEMRPEKVPKPTFWSLYGRAPADSGGRFLIENVWDAPVYSEIRRTYQRLTGATYQRRSRTTSTCRSIRRRFAPNRIT